jgi:hypothetical protein
VHDDEGMLKHFEERYKAMHKDLEKYETEYRKVNRFNDS